MKRVVLVGATGSIGAQTVEVVERSPHLELVGAVARRDADGLRAAGARLGCDLLALSEPDGGDWADPDPARFLERAQPDIVLNSAVGAAGLPWSVATLELGADLALANKESLVAGGRVMVDLARRSSSRLLPVDSEHSAVHQLLEGFRPLTRSLTITASGGPFRGRGWDELRDVTVAQALAHPTWSMGRKITIDSATLVNKGLELIEASYLFDFPEDRIEVAVQPRSIIHAAIMLEDGTHIAALSPPDMRRSISYALHHPDSVDIGLPAPPLAALGTVGLEETPAGFPAIELARRALRAQEHGGTAVFNAANEEAVAAFLDERIGLTEITDVIAAVLDDLPAAPVTDLDGVFSADRRARHRAAEIIAERAREPRP